MSTLAGGPSASDGSQAPARSEDVPSLADGVELIGQSKGSGYRRPPALVRRADGQVLQVTELLYRVLQSIDGTRTVGSIGEEVTARSGRLVTADNVRTLVSSQLLPLGLLELADGTQPAVKKSDPLLGMRFRYSITDPKRTGKLTAPFAVLFSPVIVAVVVVLFAASSWWVLAVKGLASATHNAFANPALLILIFAVTILSAGFHEFGHAAAARRGGATPGGMGVGLYLIWPAFYTDVTDSYRLGRAGRLRTDLGGLYFNAIVAVGTMAVWWFTQLDAVLLLVVTQILQMVRQLLPLVRFDGYHILADAVGVPDLFQRIKPTLLGLLPSHWNSSESKALKPWARAVVSLWVLITVPLLLVCVALMVLALPRLLGTAWSSIVNQQQLFAEAMEGGDVLGSLLRVLAIVAVVLPLVGIFYLLLRAVRQLATGVWKRTSGRPARRAVAAVAALAISAGLAWAWWPNEQNYRPVQPYERGTLFDATSSVLPVSRTTGVAEGQSGNTVTLWPDGSDLPTRDSPQLAMILVPHEQGAGPSVSGVTAGSEVGATENASVAPSWVFPFDKPPAPAEDGNQALAVNTEDGSVVYDVAFALVWAEDGPVDATNEAYAFASCTDCAAVAVGFQVVLVLGQADVVIPENLSAAVNYNCAECLTYALASQLVVTLDGPLSDGGMTELAALWEEIAKFGRALSDVPLSEIESRLNEYKSRILDIIERDAAERPAGEEPSTEPTPSETSDSGSTGGPADQQPAPGTELEPAPEQTVDPEPSEPLPAPSNTSPPPTPEPTPSVEPTPAPSPSPAPSDGAAVESTPTPSPTQG